MDINKCKFETVSIKYLDFIIEIGKNIYINSDKIKVIREWKISTTVKRIRSFLNFVNFY